jgi:polyisoprenoid-binding protein YceI
MKKYLLLLVLMFETGISQTKWSMDRAHSYVNFSVAHMMISDVTGTFTQFDTNVESEKDDFSDAKILVTIKAKSINTGNEMRDKHLRSADFFNADVDSIITFNSTAIQKLSDKKYKITGDLTMRGVTKPVVLEAQYNGKIKGYKGMIAAFKATATINRKEWGLTWNRTIEAGGLLVGENVELTIVVELIQNNNS